MKKTTLLLSAYTSSRSVSSRGSAASNLTFGGVHISELTLPELQKRKRELKQQLKQYDMNFARQQGRMPVKAEKERIRHLYESYNALKGRITLLEREGSTGVGSASSLVSGGIQGPPLQHQPLGTPVPYRRSYVPGPSPNKSSASILSDNSLSGDEAESGHKSGRRRDKTSYGRGGGGSPYGAMGSNLVNEPASSPIPAMDPGSGSFPSVFSSSPVGTSPGASPTDLDALKREKQQLM